MFENKSFRISFIVAFVFCSIAIALMIGGYADLGFGLFFFLPLAIGISSGLLPNLRQAIWGTLASLGIFSLLLIFTKTEGIICVLMAIPIILLATWIGWGVGRLFRKDKGEDNIVKVSFAPFLLFMAANAFEIFVGNPFTKNEVSTSFEIKATQKQVYDAIIQVDTVDVETHVLQKIGLPTPRKCILTVEKVGGLRLCEFEEGQIVEKITELRKNEFLRMEVTECNLSRDRHWLKFHEDIYHLITNQKGNTEITRTTTYSSNLKPRLYWKYVEALTIKTEQDFVFRNLVKDVE